MVFGFDSPQELAAVERQMVGSRRTRARAHLLDLNHRFLADLTSVRIAGDVAVDATQSITRSLSLETYDPDNVLGLQTSTTGFTAPTVMVQAWRDIFVDELGRWVPVPVFCGPITKPARAGRMLTIEAQDKGALASFETTALTIRKGTKGDVAIRAVLRHVGETRFRPITTGKVTKRDYVLTPDTTPLALARRIARDMGWVLFYDAEGYVVFRTAPTGVVFTFRTGTGGTLLSPVSNGYWDSDVVNRVIGTGSPVKGKAVTAVATLNRSHELSPENLARDGKANSGLRIARLDDVAASTEAEVKAEVDLELYRRSIQARSVSFDSRSIWHLQEHDVYAVDDRIDGVNLTARVRQMSIPLGHDGVQSNGYLDTRGPARTKSRIVTARRKAS